MTTWWLLRIQYGRALVVHVKCSPDVRDLHVSKMSFRLVNRLVDLFIVLDSCAEVFGSFFGVLTAEDVSTELQAG